MFGVVLQGLCLLFLHSTHVIRNFSSNRALMTQAYLSLTHGACSAWSARWASSCTSPRERLALCGLSAINGHEGTVRKPRTQNIGTPKLQHQRLENRGGSPVRNCTGSDDDPGIEHVIGPMNESGRRVIRDGRIGDIDGDAYGSGSRKTRPTPEVRQRQGHGQSHDTLERHVEALEAQALAPPSPNSRSGDRRSSSRSSPWSSTQSSRARGALDHYPSRPVSAGEAVAVSLISPRTSKRIRRLPRPAESELENLQVHTSNVFYLHSKVLLLYSPTTERQDAVKTYSSLLPVYRATVVSSNVVLPATLTLLPLLFPVLLCYTHPPPKKRVEHAARNFSTTELQWNKPGGLYSTIGRSKAGLIETDIDDLTATATSRKEVLAATKRAVVAKSLANHSDGILARLLGQKTTTTLPTVSPACFRDPLGTRTETPGSPKRPRPNHHTTGQRSKRGRSSGGGLVAAEAAAAAAAPTAPTAAAPTVIPEEGLELSERLRILGADENQHRENLADNLRRLRTLLGESETKGEVRRAGSPSLFSVRELRAIGAAARQRQRPNTCGAREGAPAGDQDIHGADIDQVGVQQPKGSEANAQQGGAAAELAVDGNVLLRNLAKALFSSLQSRIQNEFLILGFRKWKVK